MAQTEQQNEIQEKMRVKLTKEMIIKQISVRDVYTHSYTFLNEHI